MTQVAIAQLLGGTVSNHSLSQYEAGHVTPTPDTVDAIAEKLGLPVSFFFRPAEPKSRRPIFFRSIGKEKAGRRSAGWRLRWLARLVLYLDEFLELPAGTNVISIPVDPTVYDAAVAEAAANSLRTHWGIGDGIVSDVVLLAENNGFVVAREPLYQETEDALSTPALDGRRDYILLNADKGASVRSRFDLAHELGHMVLHRDLSMAEKLAHHATIEKQANRFAGAFLLPASRFLREISEPSLEVFRIQKPRLKASIASMIMRASALGMITDEETTKLWRQHRYRGWHKSEPFDDQLKPEVPRLLRRSIRVLLDQGIQSPADICNGVDLPPREVERIAGLPHGLLDPSQPLRFVAFGSERKPLLS